MSDDIPLIEAQIMELKVRFALYQQKYEFEPGDLVRQKHGIGHIMPSKVDKLAFMFWRYFDERNFGDQMIIKDAVMHGSNHTKYDCLVACANGDGSTVFFAMDSDTFEPFDSAER